MELETNFMATNLLSKSTPMGSGHAPFFHFLETIRVVLKWDWFCSIRHVHRKVNKCAN